MTKAQEYYNETRLIETKNWSLEMAMNFAQEYADQQTKAETKELTEEVEILDVAYKWVNHNYLESIKMGNHLRGKIALQEATIEKQRKEIESLVKKMGADAGLSASKIFKLKAEAKEKDERIKELEGELFKKSNNICECETPQNAFDGSNICIKCLKSCSALTMPSGFISYTVDCSNKDINSFSGNCNNCGKRH